MNTIPNQLWRVLSVTFAAALVFCSMLLQAKADNNLVSESQPGQQTPPAASTPAANPVDVATMDSTIAALYDVISGPGSEETRLESFPFAVYPRHAIDPDKQEANRWIRRDAN